jgi:hypothetical protein
MKIFNCNIHIKEKTYYEFFFSSYFFKKERKEFKLPTISLLMLETKNVNLIITFASSSIKISKEVTITISFYTFKFMDMVKLNVSFN